MIIFKNSSVSLEYIESQECLIQHWKGIGSSVNFREGIQKSIEIFKQKPVTRLISNTQNFGIVKKADTDWAADYAIPLMVSHGLRQMAFVVSYDIFTRLSIDNFRNQLSNKLVVRYFHELEAAKKWQSVERNTETPL